MIVKERAVVGVGTLGCLSFQKWMNFWKILKRPLTGIPCASIISENQECLLADECQTRADLEQRLDLPGHSNVGEAYNDENGNDDDHHHGDVDNDIDDDVDDGKLNLNSSDSEVINTVHSNLKTYMLQRLDP